MYLPDLMLAWNFAVQTSNERLTSSVSSILALLLKTISGQLDLRDYGVLLCRTLLHRDQLNLFSRGLSSEAHKEHLISPCLRALTEIVGFDGGTLASQVFDRQDSTFNPKFLDRNLRLFKTSGEESRRKVSVRSNAVRYLLANLRYQPVDNRIRILDHRNLFRTLFDNIKNDTFEVARDIVRSIETHVLKVPEIPRRLKTGIMTDKALSSFLDDIRSEGEDVADGAEQTSSSRRSEILGFLTRVCTNQDLGVLLVNGWYPPGTEKANDEDEGDVIEQDDLDLYDYELEDFAKNGIAVRNAILSKFLQVLRPHANLEERELGLAIFKAAPELVADHLFQGRNRFSLEPKLTNTWIGYASYFFSLVTLPVPALFGNSKEFRSKPPPASVVVENILPSPLNQKVMTRCLNQSSDLVTLFAVRILTVSLEKLASVLSIFKEASREYPVYQEAAKRLISELEGRLPTFKDMVTVTRQSADNNAVLREASTRLIRTYQSVMPQAAADESYDVAARLTTLLEQDLTDSSVDDSRLLQELELKHLLVIAGQSSGMRWWNKQGSLPFSPFVVLLRLCTVQSSSLSLKQDLSDLLRTIADDNGIIRDAKRGSSFDYLLASLYPTGTWSPTEATFNFIDECVGRLIRKPIKYMDDLEDFRGVDENGKDTTGAFLMACLEQAPFTSRLDSRQQEEIYRWLARFLFGIRRCEEYPPTKTRPVFPLEVESRLLAAGIKLSPETGEDIVMPQYSKMTRSLPVVMKESVNGTTSSEARPSRAELSRPAQESENRPELRRWQGMNADEALQDGILGSLALCLCSKYLEIRRQGLTALRSMRGKVQEESFDAKDQVDLLLGELIETASGVIDERPLSYIGGSFALHALRVLAEPTHFIFSKINRYLLKDPSWNIRKLADFWLGKTILEMPEEDNTYWKELIWVLDMLVDGVRTAEDVNVLRSRNVFERLLALGASPSAGQALRDRIAQLLFNAICAGGSTTLVTSCGLVSWLKIQKVNGFLDHAIITQFATTLISEMDGPKIDEWSGGMIMEELDSLVVPT